MRILVATDAWHPQVNGVVRSIDALVEHARPLGAEIHVLTSAGFPTAALPTYPDIRLALVRPAQIRARIRALRPDHIHIATEGPIGLATRWVCRRDGRLFTTSFHTRFPDYLAARAPVPRAWTYAALRWFHNGGAGTMVSTGSLATELLEHGFSRVMRWTRGVDPTLFRPRHGSVLDLPRPIFLSVGRIAVEKNIEAFLSLDLPGSKVCVGDGPARTTLEARYPDAHFLGTLTGESLAAVYASADVFVFQAAPTRSGSCSSRLWPADCPWPPSPCPVRSTWSDRTGQVSSTLISGAPASMPCTFRATTPAHTPSAAAGRTAHSNSSTTSTKPGWPTRRPGAVPTPRPTIQPRSERLTE